MDEKTKLYRWGGAPKVWARASLLERVGPVSSLTWSETSLFGIPGVDCRPHAMGSISVTSEQRVAQRFGQLRTEDGAAHRAASLHTAFTCALSYSTGALPEGAVFRAAVMEERWDISRWDGRLLFSNSWSGALALIAEITPGPPLHIHRIQATPDWPGAYGVGVVDYLIRSHLLDRHAAHPMPPDHDRNPEAIGSFSWITHGRRAYFASFADTFSAPDLPWPQPPATAP